MEEQAQVSDCKRSCKGDVNAVRDTLYVLNGKWKLPLIILLTEGPKRFNELQRTLGEITPKVLSKELRELELNEFLERRIVSTRPVCIIYELTPYSKSLDKVISELINWGTEHRQRIVKSRKQLAHVTPAETVGQK